MNEEDKHLDLAELGKIEDYDIFCDSKEVQGKSVKQSTENETETLKKKREREKNEEEQKETENEKKSKELENENILLYSDDENEKEIKDDSSSSNDDKDYYGENFDLLKEDLPNSDDKYEEFFGDVFCNQSSFQRNEI